MNILIYIIGFIIAYAIMKYIDRNVPIEKNTWYTVLVRICFSFFSWIIVAAIILVYLLVHGLGKLPKDPPKWM